MRLLGKCPNCNEGDSIVRQQDSIMNRGAVCEKCGQQWSDWTELCSENSLIPFGDVYQGGRSVRLWWPRKDEIPFCRLIVNFLNTALLVRFKLDVCFACEGGVQGVVKKEFKTEYVELRNDDSNIGLWDAESISYQRRGATAKILSWYADLLKTLFEEEIIFKGRNYGRTAILKLSEEKSTDETEAKFFLMLALYKKTKRREFVKRVFEKLFGVESNFLSSCHLAGLSNDDIVKFFVPPPIS